MAHKTLISGTAYSVSGGRELIGGTGYAKKKGRVLVNGTGYDIPFSSGIPIGTIPVGSVVKIGVNGKSYDFLVVNQGIPSNSSLYDSSCDGTWLLMKDIYEKRRWNSERVNDYANSEINSYLNGAFFAMLDSKSQKAIKEVKIPYRAGSGYGTGITSGANGRPVKSFLLSATEVNLGAPYEPPNEGASLSYFNGTKQGTADTKRIAYLNGSATAWWTRSPFCYSDLGARRAITVTSIGDNGAEDCNVGSGTGIRPALIVSPKTKVTGDGTYTLA